MKIESSTVFNFNFTPDGIAYNFGIPAVTQQEACEKLHKALTQIVGELKEGLKTKPN